MDKTERWWEGITRYQWLVLAVAALGGLFDTMDGNLFNLVRQVAVRELLQPFVPAASLASETTRYGGIITAIFLLGWSAGGYVFGILGDRIGRTRTMVLTILIYALFTGLAYFARTWQQLALFRFLTGLGVGGEWAAGAAIVAEVFPARSRPSGSAAPSESRSRGIRRAPPRPPIPRGRSAPSATSSAIPSSAATRSPAP